MGVIGGSPTQWVCDLRTPRKRLGEGPSYDWPLRLFHRPDRATRDRFVYAAAPLRAEADLAARRIAAGFEHRVGLGAHFITSLTDSSPEGESNA